MEPILPFRGASPPRADESGLCRLVPQFLDRGGGGGGGGGAPSFSLLTLLTGARLLLLSILLTLGGRLMLCFLVGGGGGGLSLVCPFGPAAVELMLSERPSGIPGEAIGAKLFPNGLRSFSFKPEFVVEESPPEFTLTKELPCRV